MRLEPHRVGGTLLAAEWLVRGLRAVASGERGGQPARDADTGATHGGAHLEWKFARCMRMRSAIRLNTGSGLVNLSSNSGLGSEVCS